MLVRVHGFIFLLFISYSTYVDAELLEQFRDKQFELVTSTLIEYESMSYTDDSQEEKLSILYNQFAAAITEKDLPLLEGWILQNKSNFIPYLLKGMYLSDLGWRHRGNNYIEYTPQENINKMHDFFLLAEKELLKAIDRNPKAVNAYSNLIGIYFAEGFGGTKALAIHDKGVTEYPDSAIIRSQYLAFSFPKWGISYDQRQEYVNNIERLTEASPKMKLVLSSNYVQLAKEFSNDYKMSSALYDKALSYGYQCYTHKNKAYMLFKFKHYKHALDELNILVKKCPKYAVGFLIRGRTFHKLGDVQAAMLDLDQASSLSPGNPQISGTRGYINLRQKNYWEAINDLTDALSKDQMTAWMWDNRGYAYYKLKIYDKAISDFTSTLKADPTYKRAYRRRGNSYKKIQKYDLALEDYSAGLKISPDYVSLLIQRAKLYYYTYSDASLALKDLDHALSIAPKNRRAMKLHYKIKLENNG